LQTMRKSAGFEIADYILTYYEGDDYIQQVMKDFADYVKLENSFPNSSYRLFLPLMYIARASNWEVIH